MANRKEHASFVHEKSELDRTRVPSFDKSYMGAPWYFTGLFINWITKYDIRRATATKSIASTSILFLGGSF
jgi:hypothetical protein